jgi:hypothetical protein
MNDPVLIELVRYLVAGVVFTGGIGATTFLGLMCFPSIRAALVERIRQRALRQSDATDLGAQLAALRGEVYALRTELAQAPRAALGAAREDPGREEKRLGNS